MSILNGVVPMELDSMGCEEPSTQGPSTPLRDPTSSPAVHIQWQNSQSACAAIEELRVASSVPRRPPKPLTFDFELPESAGPSSSHASDPFFSSRTRLRSARSRNIDRVQSRSQNDVFTTPAADASKFLDMLGRASARVDENSRKRMKAQTLGERERGRGPLMKGKERLCAAKTRCTRSMDELGDHTNLILDAPYSSLPIMLESQSKDTAATAEYKNDVHMHSGTSTSTSTNTVVPAPGNDGLKQPVSQNGAQIFPHRAMLSTRHSQKRIEPPSPTPIRSSTPIPFRPVPAPTASAHKRNKSSRTPVAPPNSTPGPLPPDIHSQQLLDPVPPTSLPLAHPPAVNDESTAVESAASLSSAVPMNDSLTRHGKSKSKSTTTSVTAVLTSTLLISAHPPPSSPHGHGSKRALGMTRSSVPRSFSSSSSSSSNKKSHPAATKKPFRPPLVRPGAPTPASRATMPQIPTTSSHSHDSHQDGSEKGSGTDPDSSFDISFDFDPEALEAAMKQYD